MKQRFEKIVRTTMKGVMESAKETPFDLDELTSRRAYHILLPELIFRSAHIERRFVTRFGRLWEKVGREVAEDAKGFAAMGCKLAGNIRSGREERIADVLAGRLPGTPNWDRELEYVLDAGGTPKPEIIVCDVLISSASGKHGVAFEFKSPKPNKEQAAAARKRLLTLYAMEPKPVEDAYFGLPYNPYGKRADYAWPHIRRFFEVKSDPRLLIGRELWAKLGRADAFDELMEVIREVGPEFHAVIYEEHLRTPPPPETESPPETGTPPRSR